MNRRYSRARFFAYAFVACGVVAVLFGRLEWIQLWGHETWKEHAIKQSRRLVEVDPRRGAIMDRLGYPLAVSEECFHVGVTQPANWRGRESSAALGAVLNLSGREVRRRLSGRKGHTYVAREVVIEPMVADSLRRVAGLSVDRDYRRRYPMGLAPRTLGRVNASGRGDAGFERLCDDILAGVPGRVWERHDAAGGRGATLRTPLEEPVSGRDVTLTLDHRVQSILEVELDRTIGEVGAQSAVGVVMDPWSGEVLALASRPGPPRRNQRGFALQLWRNPAISAAFEPGSSFKLFTMGSLLSRALCDTSEVWDGEGDPSMYRNVVDFGGFKIHDVHPVGEVSVRHAFVVSSNIIMAKLSSLLQPEEFYSDLRRYGFGSVTGTGLPGESAGILRDPSGWSRRSQATLSIGQEVAVTLLQLASGYAALLTDGNLRAPRFIHHWVDEDGATREVPAQVLREQVVPRSIIPTLRSLCKSVVHEEYGTGTEARVEGLVMGGKTGTAQVSEEGHVGYVPDAYTANFVGVVPADNPRLLCAIVVHRPAVEKRWGGTTAASCFARVISTVMSGTELLDGIELPPAQPTPASAEAFVQAPDLRGLRADHVLETVQSAGWQLANQPPHAMSWAVGQMPPPGATIQAGLPIRVAWSQGGRR